MYLACAAVRLGDLPAAWYAASWVHAEHYTYQLHFQPEILHLLGLLTLGSKEGGISPGQVNRVFALILYHHFLAEPMPWAIQLLGSVLMLCRVRLRYAQCMIHV